MPQKYNTTLLIQNGGKSGCLCEPMAFLGLIGYDNTYMLIQLFRMQYIYNVQIIWCAKSFQTEIIIITSAYHDSDPFSALYSGGCMGTTTTSKTGVGIGFQSWRRYGVDGRWRGAVWGSQPPNYLKSNQNSRSCDQLLWICNQQTRLDNQW